MNKILPVILFLVLITLFFGCNTPSGLVGTWKTQTLGFEQYVTFNTDGTGTTQNVLGNEAFNYKVLDDTHISYTPLTSVIGSPKEHIYNYQLVSINTLILNNITYTRYTR